MDTPYPVSIRNAQDLATQLVDELRKLTDEPSINADIIKFTSAMRINNLIFDPANPENHHLPHFT